MAIFLILFCISISALAGIIAAIAKLRKKDSDKLTYGAYLFVALISLSTIASFFKEILDYRKQLKAEKEMKTRIEAISDSISMILSDMRMNQEHIEDIIDKAQIEEKAKQEVETKIQDQENFFKRAQTFLDSLNQNKIPIVGSILDTATRNPSDTYYEVTLIVPSKMSDASIFVDNEPAEVIKNLLTLKTIRVREKNSNHLITVRKDSDSLSTSILIYKDSLVIPFTN